MSRDNGRSFRYVNGGQGNGFESCNWIDIFMLRPGLKYIFKVYAGNKFEYETIGSSIIATTMTISEENGNISDCNILGVNIINDPSFEFGNHNFKPSMGTFFHLVERHSTIVGEFVGRMVIKTRSYISNGVSQSSIKQVIKDDKFLEMIMHEKMKEKEILLSLSLYSQLESCYFTNDDFRWGTYLLIEFQDGSHLKQDHYFDTSSSNWQGALITACLTKWSKLKSIQIVAYMSAKSCVSLWDGFVLV